MFSIYEHKNAAQIPILFEKYDHEYDDYIENSNNGFNNIIEMIGSVLGENEEDIKRNHGDDIQDIDAVSDLYDELYTLEQNLLSDLFPSRSVEHDFNITIDTSYWQQKVEDNNKRLDEKSARFEDYDEDYYKERIYVQRSEDNAIDDLFSKID